MPRIIDIVSRKGGVKKTTSAVHLAAKIASHGFKTALIDFDTSQGNTTMSVLGKIWNTNPEMGGICDVFCNNTPIDDVVYETNRENLFVVPTEKYDSNGNSYNIEGYISQFQMDGFHLLSEKIAQSEILQEMNFIFIDTPPNLGSTTVCSLVASDYFLIPVNMDFFSLESVEDTIKTTNKIRKGLNTNLGALGIYVTEMDLRSKYAKESLKKLKGYCEENNIHFFDSIIPTSTKFKDLPEGQRTIYDLKGSKIRGKKEYEDLSMEMLNRMMALEKGATRTREVRI